jgi:hypothetical protein
MTNPIKVVRQASMDLGGSGLSFSDILKEELNMVVPTGVYSEKDNPIKFTGEGTFEASSKIPVATIEAAIRRATDRIMKRLANQGNDIEQDVSNAQSE